MKIFLFFGASGSGKSVLPLHICSENKTELVTFRSEEDPNKAKSWITIVPDRKLVMIGKYTGKCGGTDSISRTIDGKNGADLVFEAIYTAIEQYKNKGYNILAEGMLMASFGFSRHVELQEFAKKNGIEVISVFFTATAEESYKRVLIRNGGKPVQISHIEKRRKDVIKRAMKFKDLGYICYKFDNTGTKEELINRLTKLIES